MEKNKIPIQQLIGKGYEDFLRCTRRYRVCKGSRASKKSKTAALELIYRIIRYPLSNALCVRRYRNTLRDSMFSDLRWAINRLGSEDNWECSVSPMQIVYKPTGQKILFRGLDDGMKITSISVERGTLCFVWVEEAYEIREDDFDKLDMSIRGELPQGYFKQITLTFNPWSANSWLKKRFFDTFSDDVFTMTTTWECNEWLGEDDRKIFLDMKERNPRRYRIEGKGEWGVSQGLIYENTEVIEFDIDELRKKGLKSAYGLDFGYTDPNAFVAMLIDESCNTIYVFDEFYKTGITNKQIAAEIKRRGYGSERIICDCAEPKSIAELRDEGIRAEASSKGRDSVNHGIQSIQNYKITILPKCVEFIKEISNYCWGKTKDGNPIDRPDHEFSHGMDAMRYGVQKAIMPPTFSFE